ncbi:hypothetical protein FGO68_gene14807 [Halteria grandinella]|uniref:Uncharacterized protein n=1 Tax=Halteria grandinella TaxID=5974 RepID=A0A8J8NTE2_HALGN|nr:hypothetical protein FGO68_gene14807 [Halteria grandinella]
MQSNTTEETSTKEPAITGKLTFIKPHEDGVTPGFLDIRLLRKTSEGDIPPVKFVFIIDNGPLKFRMNPQNVKTSLISMRQALIQLSYDPSLQKVGIQAYFLVRGIETISAHFTIEDLLSTEKFEEKLEQIRYDCEIVDDSIPVEVTIGIVKYLMEQGEGELYLIIRLQERETFYEHMHRSSASLYKTSLKQSHLYSTSSIFLKPSTYVNGDKLCFNNWGILASSASSFLKIDDIGKSSYDLVRTTIKLFIIQRYYEALEHNRQSIFLNFNGTLHIEVKKDADKEEFSMQDNMLTLTRWERHMSMLLSGVAPKVLCLSGAIEVVKQCSSVKPISPEEDYLSLMPVQRPPRSKIMNLSETKPVTKQVEEKKVSTGFGNIVETYDSSIKMQLNASDTYRLIIQSGICIKKAVMKAYEKFSNSQMKQIVLEYNLKDDKIGKMLEDELMHLFQEKKTPRLQTLVSTQRKEHVMQVKEGYGIKVFISFHFRHTPEPAPKHTLSRTQQKKLLKAMKMQGKQQQIPPTKANTAPLYANPETFMPAYTPKRHEFYISIDTDHKVVGKGLFKHLLLAKCGLPSYQTLRILSPLSLKAQASSIIEQAFLYIVKVFHFPFSTILLKEEPLSHDVAPLISFTFLLSFPQ